MVQSITVNNWHNKSGTCSKKRKRLEINRLIDIKGGDLQTQKG